MNLRSLPVLLVAATLVLGCKSGDSTASAASASPKSPSDTAASEATKPSSDAPATSGNSVVGSWTHDDKDLEGTTIEFKGDGTIAIAGTNPKGTTLEASETYALDGDKMTVKPTSMKLTAAANADEKTKKDVDETNRSLTPEAYKNIPPDVETVKWIDKDTFTTTGASGKVVTFKRKA